MTRRIWRRTLAGTGLMALILALGAPACENTDVDHNYPRPRDGRGSDPSPEAPRDTIFGPGGFSVGILGDTGNKGQPAQGGTGIAVNSYLWRASLETMSFMPLTSADPFGGVIITDWYSPPETPDERFKATVYILERQLRANGVKVAVFRQTRAGPGDWRDVSIKQETSVALENAILTRARQLRVSALGTK